MSPLDIARDEWPALLCHALGIREDTDLTVEHYRNRFATSHDDPRWLAMVSEGLAVRGAAYPGGVYFHASEAGIIMARRHEAERRRAAGLRRWIVSYDCDGRGYSHTVTAKSRSAARWRVASGMMEVGMTPRDALACLRVHSAEPKRERIA